MGLSLLDRISIEKLLEQKSKICLSARRTESFLLTKLLKASWGRLLVKLLKTSIIGLLNIRVWVLPIRIVNFNVFGKFEIEGSDKSMIIEGIGKLDNGVNFCKRMVITSFKGLRIIL